VPHRLKTLSEHGPTLGAFYDSLVEQERRRKVAGRKRIRRRGMKGKEMKGKRSQPVRTSMDLFWDPHRPRGKDLSSFDQ